MPSVDLTPYYQPQSSTSDGTKFDNLIAAIQAALNALDNSNFVPGTPLAVSKLAPGTNGQYLQTSGGVTVWASAAGGTTAGAELDYAQIAVNPSGITATTEGTSVAVITGSSIAYDGSRVKVEFFIPKLTATGAIEATFVVYRDATVIGQVGVGVTSAPAGVSVLGSTFDTPSAASHTYALKVFVSAGTLTVNAGAGGAGNLVPAWLRVTRA